MREKPIFKAKIIPNSSHFLLFFFLLTTLIYSQEPVTEQTTSPILDFVFLTGREQGTYYPVGMTIKEIINSEYPKIQILCEPSHGSLDNARLIESDRADLAIIQSDISYYLYTGTRIFSLPSDKIRGICPLYTEAIHIITKKDIGIKSIKDLKGKIVSVGLKDSGSEFNARIILHALSVTYQDITPVYESFDQSINLLENNEIDAFFVTTKVPISTLILPFQVLNLRLISFSKYEIEKITKAYPYFYFKIIDAKTYPNQKNKVLTLGVTSLLVAHSYKNRDDVYKVTEALFKNKGELERKYPFISLNSQEAVDFMPIPLHAGAEKYYKEIGILEPISFFYYLRIIFIAFLIIFILIYFMQKFPNKARVLINNIYIRFLSFFLIFVFLGSWGMYLSEKRINENFNSVSQSFWSCIVYLFSGFEDRSPITPGGKIISVFIFILGVSIFGIISGRFASFFVEKAFKKEKKMPKNIKNHIIICNWNNRGEYIVDELYNADTNLDISILTNIEIPNEEDLQKRNEYKKVHFARGDPAIHDRLEASKIQQAKSVIILANETSQDPDAQSALIALAISKVCGEERPHIIAEALNHRKVHHLEDAGVNEVICAIDYGTGLMAQASLHPGLTQVYDRLLSYSRDTNEIYVIDKENVPSSLKIPEMTFSKAAEILSNKLKGNNPVLLLGVMREGKPVINPKKGKDKIKKDDDFIVLSYFQPDLSEIE